MPGPPLGAHVSIAGGVERSIERARELRCETVQIFVKNASQWAGKPLDEASVEAFRGARAGSPLGAIVAHASYLINLAARDRAILRKSRRALADELDRCERLGIDGLVVHPGAHLGAGEERGAARVAESLDRVFAGRARAGTRILLENTAGQGTVLGHRLEQLAAIRDACSRPHRLGVCLDTCHAFAAGYEVHREAGYEALFARFRELFSDADLGCIHVNDSKRGLGSRRDRHANLGRGEIGSGLFRRLVADPRLFSVPMILETPMGEESRGHRRDLKLLKTWRTRAARRAAG